MTVTNSRGDAALLAMPVLFVMIWSTGFIVARYAMPNAPGWLKPFNLRNRVAFVDQYLNNTVTSYTEYRVQLNYELTWKGPRLRQASAH